MNVALEWVLIITEKILAKVTSFPSLSVALVMFAWNYPVFTALPPVASAIAAGN